MRCFFCGNKKALKGELGCCAEHTQKATELQILRMEKNLCFNCGEKIYVDSKGEKFPLCYDCLMRNTKTAEAIKKMFKFLKGEDKSQ